MKPVEAVYFTAITFIQVVKVRFISLGYNDLYNMLKTHLSY